MELGICKSIRFILGAIVNRMGLMRLRRARCACAERIRAHLINNHVGLFSSIHSNQAPAMCHRCHRLWFYFNLIHSYSTLLYRLPPKKSFWLQSFLISCNQKNLLLENCSSTICVVILIAIKGIFSGTTTSIYAITEVIQY